MKRRLLLGSMVLLGWCWVFLVSLVYLAPVEWLVLQARSGVLQVFVPTATQRVLQQTEWQALEGKLGYGRVVQLEVAGQQFQTLQWSIHPVSLLLFRPALRVTVDSRQPWLLRVSPAGINGFRLELQAGDLAAVKGKSPLPWQLDGDLAGTLQLHGQWLAGRLQCIRLQGQLSGPVRLVQPLSLELGQVGLHVECRDADQLHWALTADQPAAHQVRVEGQLYGNRWQFQAQAAVAEQAELARILQLLNWQRQEAITQGEMAPGQVYQGRGGGQL